MLAPLARWRQVDTPRASACAALHFRNATINKIKRRQRSQTQSTAGFGTRYRTRLPKDCRNQRPPSWAGSRANGEHRRVQTSHTSKGGCSGRMPRSRLDASSRTLYWTPIFGNATLAPHSLLACIGCGARFSLPGNVPSPYPPRSGYAARSTAAAPTRPASAASLPPLPTPTPVFKTTSPHRRPCRASGAAKSCSIKPVELTGTRALNPETIPHRRIETVPDRRPQAQIDAVNQ